MKYRNIALVPAYEPDLILLDVLIQLKNASMEIILVDDGSGPQYANLFGRASSFAKVLTHDINKGKGAALKTGMTYIKKTYGQDCIIVTVDADGQHRAEDAIKLCCLAAQHPNTLFLGSRKLKENVPLRSQLGNTITRFVYRFSTGLKVHDTQTGLRAFCGRLLQELLLIDGERYEYEMNVLLEFARRHIPIQEMEIDTVYIDNNSASHFDTLRDSFRIYKEILKFSAASFVGFLVDYTLYSLLLLFTANLWIANTGARIASATVNYTINRKIVFHSKNGIAKSAVQYFMLAAAILFGNTLFLALLVNSFGANQMSAKILTEILFFILSWLVQRGVIFRRKEADIMFWKKYAWTILYSVLLISFTAYVLLDTFVITQVYAIMPSEQNQISGSVVNTNETEKGNGSDQENPNTDTSEDTPAALSTSDYSYDDGNIAITITEYREYDSSIYVADILVDSAEYLQTAFAKGGYGKNVTEKTSETAQNNDAILAINGDYYGAQEKGYVLRNGVVYRDTPSQNQEDLAIYADGSFSVITESGASADELLASGVQQVLSFGPALVMDSNISVTEDEEVGKAKTSNPRTAIGIVDELHYVFVVSDGRIDESEGLTLYELAEFMQSLGVTTAYNLDGGGSSTMYFNGEVINNPTTNGKSIKERSVSDIVYIGY